MTEPRCGRCNDTQVIQERPSTLANEQGEPCPDCAMPKCGTCGSNDPLNDCASDTPTCPDLFHGTPKPPDEGWRWPTGKPPAGSDEAHGDCGKDWCPCFRRGYDIGAV